MTQIGAMSGRECLGNKETRAHSEYRTKRLALKRAHTLAIAIASGNPHVSAPAPPSGDAGAVLHSDRQDTGERPPHGS
jgi:hypothetical protein